MTDSMPRPNDDEIIEEVAQVLDLDQAAVDALKLSIMETHEKAQNLLDKSKELGHVFSVKQGEDIFVNLSWLGTMLLMEGEQVMRGHGGCPDHLRVVDWLETTVMAAQKNHEQELDSTE
jgi:hypothetical protein